MASVRVRSTQALTAFMFPATHLQRPSIRESRPASFSATLIHFLSYIPSSSSSVPRPEINVVKLQQWLQNTSFPLPGWLSSIEHKLFLDSQHGDILQRREIIDQDDAICRVLANSSLSPCPTRINEYSDEYHIFKLRWPYSEHTNVHPKLKQLMKDIGAKHYALVVGQFLKHPTELSLHGRTIELTMTDISGIGTRQQVLEEPDGQSVGYVLGKYWKKFANDPDVEALGPPFLTYVATVEYPFAREDWLMLAELAAQVLASAGWTYDCVGMNCGAFCERMCYEICKVAQERKVRQERFKAHHGLGRACA